MAEVVKSPFTDAVFKPKSGSSLEGAQYAGGDIRVAGQDVVIGGPQISEEPAELFGFLKSLP